MFQKWRGTEIAGTLGLIVVASRRKAWPRPFLAVRCPPWPRAPRVPRGTTARGPQRDCCQHPLGAQGRLRLAYGPRGCGPERKPALSALRRPARGGVRRRDPCLAGPPPGGGHARSPPRPWRRCPPRGCARCPPRRWPGLWCQRAQRRGRRGGRGAGRKVPHALPPRAKAGPLWVGGVRRRWCCRCKPCANRVGAPQSLAMLGAPPGVPALRPRPRQASAPRSKASVSPCRGAHA